MRETHYVADLSMSNCQVMDGCMGLYADRVLILLKSQWLAFAFQFRVRQLRAEKLTLDVPEICSLLSENYSIQIALRGGTMDEPESISGILRLITLLCLSLTITPISRPLFRNHSIPTPLFQW